MNQGFSQGTKVEVISDSINIPVGTQGVIIDQVQIHPIPIYTLRVDGRVLYLPGDALKRVTPHNKTEIEQTLFELISNGIGLVTFEIEPTSIELTFYDDFKIVKDVRFYITDEGTLDIKLTQKQI